MRMKAQTWHIHGKDESFQTRKKREKKGGYCNGTVQAHVRGRGRKKRARELRFWIQDQKQQQWAPEGSWVEKKCLERPLSSFSQPFPHIRLLRCNERENSSSSDAKWMLKLWSDTVGEKGWAVAKKSPLVATFLLSCSRVVGFNHLLPTVKSSSSKSFCDLFLFFVVENSFL